MIKVTFFFRKPFQDYFSIEGVFGTVQKDLSAKVDIKNYTLKKFSKGVFNRVSSCFEVLKHLGDINHITGDIHYVSYLMPTSRTILTIHDLAPLKNSSGLKHVILKFFWYQLPLWSVKYVTVISEFTKQELTESLKVRTDKIKVVRNPVPNGILFEPKKEIAAIPRLLQVGTSYNKNLEGLIEAILDLKVQLHIIGSLSKEQEKLLMDGNIDYVNSKNLDYNQVLECYRASDIVCFATFYEGFGLPILEAQATGRPVITSNRCAMPETAGDAAILINPDDISAYRQAIKSLIDDAQLRSALVAKGHINIKRFAAEAIAEEYLVLYKTMLNEAI